MLLRIIADVRPSVLQLSEEGGYDNFLEAVPLIDVYLHVVLQPLRTACVHDETLLFNERNTKNCLIITVCVKVSIFYWFQA